MPSHLSLRFAPLLSLLALAAACDYRHAPVAPTQRGDVTMPSAGNRIAFTSSRDGNTDIYVMNADGTGVTRLTDNPADDRAPSWSPDGRRIAFASTRNGNSEIYVMNADGTGVTRLTADAHNDGDPAWCGNRIAFTSDRYLPPFPDVYVMNDDGSGVTRLTIDNTAFDRKPAWSPNCDVIAFTKDPDGDVEIYVMNADGTGVTRLTNSVGYDEDPAWSPDGTKIAFTSTRDGDPNREIYVMNADGTGATRLTNTSLSIWDTDPSWSFDGSQIAFRSNRDGNDDIYVMNVDGTGLTRLTNDPSSEVLPAWFGAVGSNLVPWPNEPLGFTTLTSWPFNQWGTNADASLAWGPNPWNQAPGTGDTAIVNDLGAPFSPLRVVQLTYPVGMPSGTDPWGLYFDPSPAGREFYTAFWWKANAGWEGEPSGINKIAYWKDNTPDGPIGSIDIVMSNQGQPAYFLAVILEFTVATNDHLVNTVGSETVRYAFGNVNGGNYEIVPGNWYRIEVYFKGSTTPTSQDGIVRWWATKRGDVTSTQVGDYTTANFDARAFAEFVIGPTWGGNSGARKTQTDYYWYDHAYVSAP
jgi:TolB protein